MALFRKARPQEPLVVAVTGARLAQRIVTVVGRDTKPLLQMAARVGITGRAFALAPGPEAVSRVEAAAIQAGVLVEVAPLALPLPLEDDSFDLAVIDDRTPRDATVETSALLPELLRVVRPGGRVVVMLPAPRHPFAGLFGSTAPPPDVSPILRTLAGAGLAGCRLLASREGTTFVEAAKPDHRRA